MKFFRSIRWRLQLWHGAVFALVIAGFALTAWSQQRAIQIQRVDRELERRIAVIVDSLRRPGTGRGPQGRPDPARPRPAGRPAAANAPAPTGFRLSPREESLFDDEGGLYYVVWNPDGGELARSPAAPSSVPLPPREVEPVGARTRGSLREYHRYTGQGECVLIGRDIRDELAGIVRFGWFLAAAGGAILLLGLAGGWWVTGRALLPVAAISATAARISKGDLSQRIRTTDGGSELDELAAVLNDTFARLQASFERQVRFTADAAHELRTPLAVVLTQAQAALARERSAGEYRESLAACERAARRMQRLSESLLTLARLDSGETGNARERCELDCIAHEAIEWLRPLADEHRVELAADLRPAACDGNAAQLGQVATNLLDNAIRHNPPCGRVRVRVWPEGGDALLEVADHGSGIAPADLPHVFERFYRGDPSRSTAHGGSGLGLAITKAIVEAHGGAVTAVSEPGQGSTFTVRLPAAGRVGCGASAVVTGPGMC